MFSFQLPTGYGKQGRRELADTGPIVLPGPIKLMVPIGMGAVDIKYHTGGKYIAFVYWPGPLSVALTANQRRIQGVTAKKRVESILDFQLICHLHSGTKCLHTWYKPLTICTRM